jgi:hypothetical protein
MQINKKAIPDRLRKSDVTGVFTQKLGWNFPPDNLTLTVVGKQAHLQAVAEKEGLRAEGRLCISHEGDQEQETQIICSMELRSSQEGI